VEVLFAYIIKLEQFVEIVEEDHIANIIESRLHVNTVEDH